ncbi:MAG TPA: hypothetical protein VJ124_06270, partial [Pyrinomonadaceae bacterium]|nr:hypothetical protein [Pyrinomonadaceae bacterium]
QRIQQAQVVNNFVDSLLAIDPAARVIVLGDLNDFQFSAPLATLAADVLNNLVSTLPAAEEYTYIFDGNSQVLDHILLSDSLYSLPRVFDIVHANAEFSDTIRPTDHDPSVVKICLSGSCP